MTVLDEALLERCAVLSPLALLRALADPESGSASGSAAGLDAIARPPAPSVDGRRVDVTLWLTGGSTVDGRLVAIGRDHGETVVVLHCEGRTHSGRLVYIRGADVAGVAVEEPDRLRDRLTGGRLATRPDGPAPTRLQLRREFTATAELPLHVDWDSVPDAPEALAGLRTLLRALDAAARSIRGDELGRAAWEAISAVNVGHEPAATLRLGRHADAVLLRVDLTAALPDDAAGALRDQLEALL